MRDVDPAASRGLDHRAPPGLRPPLAAPFQKPQSRGGAELKNLNQLTELIIGGAIEVHRQLGPGLLESIYEAPLCLELDDIGLAYQRQLPLPVLYKGRPIGTCRLDLPVEDAIVVDIKAVDRFDPVFQAQVLTYLRIARKTLGLLINFNTRLLKDGVKRVILKKALRL